MIWDGWWWCAGAVFSFPKGPFCYHGAWKDGGVGLFPTLSTRHLGFLAAALTRCFWEALVMVTAVAVPLWTLTGRRDKWLQSPSGICWIRWRWRGRQRVCVCVFWSKIRIIRTWFNSLTKLFLCSVLISRRYPFRHCNTSLWILYSQMTYTLYCTWTPSLAHRWLTLGSEGTIDEWLIYLIRPMKVPEAQMWKWSTWSLSCVIILLNIDSGWRRRCSRLFWSSQPSAAAAGGLGGVVWSSGIKTSEEERSPYMLLLSAAERVTSGAHTHYDGETPPLNLQLGKSSALPTSCGTTPQLHQLLHEWLTEMLLTYMKSICDIGKKNNIFLIIFFIYWHLIVPPLVIQSINIFLIVDWCFVVQQLQWPQTIFPVWLSCDLLSEGLICIIFLSFCLTDTFSKSFESKLIICLLLIMLILTGGLWLSRTRTGLFKSAGAGF